MKNRKFQDELDRTLTFSLGGDHSLSEDESLMRRMLFINYVNLYFAEKQSPNESDRISEALNKFDLIVKAGLFSRKTDHE
jgi:hypothetical protein